MEHFALPPELGQEILRCEVGSTLHGTGLDGHEDHDEMGIFLERPTTTIGLGHVEQYQKRSKPEGVKSEHGDTDLVVYTARKWAQLALGGNPTVLLLLFAPDDKLMSITDEGYYLREHRDWFVSQRSGKAFLGYLEQQRQRLTGERGRAGRIRVRECPDCGGRKNIFVPEEGAGIPTIELGPDGPREGSSRPCETCQGTGRLPDWKYAMHMLRLGYQGVEFLESGTLTLPVPGDVGDHLRRVRQGKQSLKDCIEEAQDLEEEIKVLLGGESPIPKEPNTRAAESWLIQAHTYYWSI